MRVVRGASMELLGLFVSDWSQAIGILVILGAGYVASRVVHGPAVGFGVALLLAIHLVVTTTTESRRRAARPPGGR